MEKIEKLMAHVRKRPSELTELKKNGAKIIGYVPNGYFPEELIYACNAIPVGLNHGGDHEAVIASEACLFRLLDTFCRSQIGYRRLGKDILYHLLDLLVVPITDRNITAIADSWELYTDIEVFKLGVPRYTGLQHAFEYYRGGLDLLKKRLEDFTCTKIKPERLIHEIELSNNIRDLLGKISDTRLSMHPGISGKDFILLNHATYCCDRDVLLSTLEEIAADIVNTESTKPDGPRILLIGSTLADGDYKVVDLLEEAGANIVFEEFSEGIRHYQQKIDPRGDIYDALADRYLNRRVPPAFFHEVIKLRFDYLCKLIQDYKVDGVVYYSLLYRDSYDREGLLFSKFLERNNRIPFLKISSDYDVSETAQMRTRIETFMEIIKRGR